MGRRLRAMRISDFAIGGALFVLLTSLLLGGLLSWGGDTSVAMNALDRLGAKQTALHRDILRARVGILRDDAPFARHLVSMDEDMATLRSALRSPETALLGKQIAARVDRQRALTGQFLTANAPLQVALAEFRRVSDALRHRKAAVLPPDIKGLSSEMLPLSHVTSMIGAVEATCGNRACAPEVQRLVANARQIHALLPQVDAIVSELAGIDRTDGIIQLRGQLHAQERDLEKRSVRFRLLQYGVSLILLYLLMKREGQLRLRAAELRRQVDLEHAVASLSTLLIGGGEDIVDRVRAGLEQVAGALGASRAYFGLREGRIVCLWPPADGDERALAAALHAAWEIQSGREGIIRLDARSPRPDEAALLRGLGAKSWIGVFGGEGGSGGLLAFDLPRHSSLRSTEHMAVLRTAFDAICLALEHDAVERERRELQDRLARVRRMETIGTFTSGIAHNLNNIIGAIAGFAEMAQAVAEGTGAAPHIQQIQLAAQRGQNLMEGLLDYGRSREYRLECVDLDALVRETAALAEAALAPLHTIAVAAGMDGKQTLTDAGQIQQVILNLCRNAAQAMPGGGIVHLETEILMLGETLQHVHGKLDPGIYATITVRDTGSGIARERLHRLFEPFYTTKPDGNGLGLSTAREILRELGGRLTIDSEAGLGTRARIWLPLRDHAGTADGRPSGVAAPERGNGEVVLAMIEHGSARLAAEEMLAALGYEPLTVASGEQLLDLVERRGDDFDVVAICAPEGDFQIEGLLAALRARRPSLPRILAVGPSSQGRRLAQAARAHGTMVIPCPPGPAALAQALRASLRTSR